MSVQQSKTIFSSSKSEHDFSFRFPLKHKVVRGLKIVTEEVGELEVEGKGYIHQSESKLDVFDRYDVDIDFIKWNGTDIKPVLEVTGGMEEIVEAAGKYVANHFDNQTIAA